ncbi:unnamed protein product [Gordionus sp. m RMFG-2023]
MIATIANNLECYLKIQNIKFEGTKHTAKCKYNTHLSLPSTQSQDTVILPDILISSNGIPHLEPQVSPIVPDISISSNGIPHLEPQVST